MEGNDVKEYALLPPETDIFFQTLIKHRDVLPDAVKRMVGRRRILWKPFAALLYLSLKMPDIVIRGSKGFEIDVSSLHNYIEQLTEQTRQENEGEKVTYEKSYNEFKTKLDSLIESRKGHVKADVFYTYMHNKQNLTSAEIQEIENHIDNCDKCRENKKLFDPQ